MWIVALVIALGALWDGFTTFFGIVDMFNIFDAEIVNPYQVIFAIVVSIVIFGFMLATQAIWSYAMEDPVTVLLRIAWFLCLMLDFYTSYKGNKYFVFDNKIEETAHVLALIIVTFLITVSTILLSRLIMSKDARGKGFHW